jgi:hypothetical protein
MISSIWSSRWKNGFSLYHVTSDVVPVWFQYQTTCYLLWGTDTTLYKSTDSCISGNREIKLKSDFATYTLSLQVVCWIYKSRSICCFITYFITQLRIILVSKLIIENSKIMDWWWPPRAEVLLYTFPTFFLSSSSCFWRSSSSFLSLSSSSILLRSSSAFLSASSFSLTKNH